MKPFESARQTPGELASFVKSAAVALALSACLLPPGAWAQLSSPLAGAVPSGSGAGVHSPDSPFAPLPPRADVLPWSLLTSVKTEVIKKRALPRFSAEVLALNEQPQRIQGFMMPLEPGEKQKHFLLTAVPLTCSFCTPGGPESMVEVFTTTPVKYTMEALVVSGRLSVLADDPYGLYYRIKDAVLVK